MRLLPVWDATILRGKFFHLSLNDTILYTAISYCWATDLPSRKLWVAQGGYVPVTPSLHYILEALRSDDKQCLYWIDALCIDQYKRSEKPPQLRLMRDIYANAQEVIAFIGEPSEDSDLTMHFLGALELSIRTLNFVRGNGILDDINKGGRHSGLDMQTLVETDFMKYPSPG